MEKFCQSCGRRLYPEQAGTNADGGLSHMYCERCFQNGRYTDSPIDFDYMVRQRRQEIEMGNAPAWKKRIKQFILPITLQRKARWEMEHSRKRIKFRKDDY